MNVHIVCLYTELMMMTAVQEQKTRFRDLSNKFSRRLSHHLNNLFVHKVRQVPTWCAHS